MFFRFFGAVQIGLSDLKRGAFLWGFLAVRYIDTFYLEDDAEGVRRFADIERAPAELKELAADGVFGDGFSLSAVRAAGFRIAESVLAGEWRVFRAV